jgi:rhodanese-related sulfurtransferase
MFKVLLLIVSSVFLIAAFTWRRRRTKKRELLLHTISAETLHELLESDQKPDVVDLRLPLDFLVHTETIPGAQRISPREIIGDPSLLSKDRDYVLYCTCPGEQSSEDVLAAALKMGFSKVKILAGGLEAWKQKGYPVAPYEKSFRLDVQ